MRPSKGSQKRIEVHSECFWGGFAENRSFFCYYCITKPIVFCYIFISLYTGFIFHENICIFLRRNGFNNLLIKKIVVKYKSCCDNGVMFFLGVQNRFQDHARMINLSS